MRGRSAIITLALALAVLSGCSDISALSLWPKAAASSAQSGQAPRPLATAQISTQTLAPLGSAAGETAAKAQPTGASATAPASIADPSAKGKDAAATQPTASPAPPKSPQEAACRASGGQWSQAGSSIVFACVRPTKDAGKACSKESDCSSQCLARSRSCAPIWPIFGCTEVIQNNGIVANLCLE